MCDHSFIVKFRPESAQLCPDNKGRLVPAGIILDIRELQSISLSYVNEDLIFLSYFSCHSYRLTSQKKIFFFFCFSKGFPGGVWKLRVRNFHISLTSLYQMSACSKQTNKPNQTRTSPARSHTPNETKGKEMPRNLKKKKKVAGVPPKDGKVMPRHQMPNGISAKHDFRVPLDL